MSLKKWLCVMALFATFVHSLSARNLFLTPADATGNTITIYTSDPLSFANTVASATGAFQVLPSLSPNKFYVLSRSSTETLSILDGTFPALNTTRRIQLNAPAVAGTLTSDGRRLAVLANGVHILDTSSDSLITTGGPIAPGGTGVGLAPLIDANRIVALSTTQLTFIDATLGYSVFTIPIPTQASAVTAGPDGLIYVSAQDAIHQIDPNSLTIRATIPVRGLPGKLSFTPDGTVAVALNTATLSNGVAGYGINLQTRVVTELASPGFSYDKIVVANGTTAYALSIAQGRVYTIALAGGVPSGSTPLANAGAPLDGIRDLTSSTEGDRIRYIFLATAAAVYRVDTSSGAVTGPISAPLAGNLSFAPPPSTAGVSQIQVFNATQTLNPGQTTLPLVVRAIDTTGNPVSNLPVTFTATTGGLSVQGSTRTTNLLGSAQAYVQVPVGFTTATITITPTVGSIISNTPFTINVNTTINPGGGNGGGTGGGTGASGGLTIVLGQGEVVSANGGTFLNTEPLTVQLKDAQGNPVAGQSITWTLASGQGGVTPSVSVTDATGKATADFASTAVVGGVAYVQSVVQASTGTDTVSFYLTTVPGIQGTTFGGQVNAFLTQPTSRVINARAGEVNTNAVEITAVSPLGIPIPNVGLRVTTVTNPNQNVGGNCRGGYVLTDDKGVAHCDFVATGSGSGTVQAVIGSQIRFDIVLNVTPGGATTITASSGGNQTGAPGTQLTTPLVATLTDSNNAPAVGASVIWEVVSGSATLRNQVTTSDAQGHVSAAVTLGTTPGPVQIRVRSATGTASATFNLTVGASGTQITAAGGDAQTAITGQAFAQPLQVRILDAQNAPVVNAPVTFALTSGSAALATTSTATNAQGIATTTVTAGTTAGPVVVTATSGALTTRFNLTVQPVGPVFTASSVVNGASFQAGISPGSIATIYVSGIAPSLRGTVVPGLVAPLPTKLSDVEVLFNGINAPIYSVSNINGQESVTVQVPVELPVGSASVMVRTANGGSTTVNNVAIQQLSPGVFETTDPANGRKYAVAYRQDGTQVTSTNPAQRGDLIRFFATGLGTVAPASGTNRIGSAGQSVTAPVVAGLNNAGVRLVSAEYLTGAIGVYVITVEVPVDAASSTAAPLGLVLTNTSGANVYANGTSLPIQ